MNLFVYTTNIDGLVFRIYNNLMEIEFAPSKDHANRSKHDVSLALATELEWELAWVEQDTRKDYDEIRMIGYAPIGSTVYCVVFTELNDHYRIVSLRPATPREVRSYASQI